VRGGAAFFAASCVGRLGISMTGLGILWLVHHFTGSFVLAGTATGLFAIAEATVGPQTARIIDRHGQPRVLRVLVAVHGVSMATLIVTAAWHAPLAVVGATAVLAGSSIPQLGAVSATRWIYLLTDHQELSAAFSLEAVANDVAFLAGPTLIGLVSSLISPVVGLAGATSFVVASGATLAVLKKSAPPPRSPASHPDRDRRLLRPAFLVLLALNLGLGLFFGAMQVSVTGFAIEHGRSGIGGALYSVMSLGSLIGGIAYGSRRWAWTPQKSLVALSLYFFVTSAALTLAPGLAVLGLLLAIAGVAIAPIMVVAALLTERQVLASHLTQALTWMNSASAAGIAGSAVAAGAVVDAFGARAGLLLGAGFVLLLLAAAGISLRGQETTTMR
jgi:predicted MFS family arabinose efflux permease